MTFGPSFTLPILFSQSCDTAKHLRKVPATGVMKSSLSFACQMQFPSVKRTKKMYAVLSSSMKTCESMHFSLPMRLFI